LSVLVKELRHGRANIDSKQAGMRQKVRAKADAVGAVHPVAALGSLRARGEYWLDNQANCYYDLNVMTFDEPKRADNIAKHGIDLALCESVFDSPMVTTEDDSEDYGELRLKSFGLLDWRVVVLIWTDRADGPHVISCRYGDKHEAKRYFEQAY
jgi:uncharacterized DUF497 family protein